MEIIDQTAKVVMLKGEGGDSIKSIDKTTTQGLVDVYTITLASGKKTTFNVKNGNGIKSIKKTSANGLIDTYTITFDDGETTTFTVANGKGISKIEKIGTNVLTDTYKITYNDGTTQNYNVTNGKGISSISKTGTNGLVDTYTITYNDGTTSTFTVVNGKDGKDGGITVDDALSETSTNPVQNKAITNSINDVTGKLQREVLRTLPNISISKNVDINTPEYLNIGTYYCPSISMAQTISNIPVKRAFCMYVIAPLGGTYGSESSGIWTYRVRIFITFEGGIYVQYAYAPETAGVYTYGSWKKLISSDELNTITNSEIDTILNS